jgi:TonB-dependent receptor
MIRRSPDRNTGEVIKRTPGASLQDGKFLIIRGLADRYNLAMLNGVPLSSTEPDRKTFSFDMIPSSMIDNIVINKAFVPELPAEWAGGLVQVNTRDIPSQNFFNIQAGTGFNTQTVANTFYGYQGGKLDWLGIDDGYRALPAPYTTKGSFNDATKTAASDKAQLIRNMKNVWSGHSVALPINQQFQANAGFNTKVLGNKSLGGVFGVTYNRQMKFTRLETDDNVVNADGTYTKNSAYNDGRYAQDVLWGALGNLALQLNNDHKISIKTLFNVNTTKYLTDRTGLEDFGNALMDSVKATELTFRENMLFNAQVSGDHNLFGRKVKFHWYGSFNTLSGYQPDQRRLFYNKDNTTANAPYIALIGNTLSQRTGSRLYQTLSDYVYTAGGDASYSFNWLNHKQTVKGGYLFQVKDRLFDAKFFSIYLPSTGDQSLRLLPADKIFSPENFDEGNGRLFGFDMIKGDNFRYLANTILNAGFIQFDNQFTSKLRAVWGIRVENYDQLIGSVYTSSSKHGHTEVRDWLPGANITYKLNNKTNLRLSGSQTVVRPEFRELADFTYYDFDLNGTVSGVKTLQRTKVTNADLRYELYPRAGEMITIGMFYKYFQNPIIQRFNRVSGNTYVFDNADNGYTYGPEIEFRKRLDFVGNTFRNFTFQTNLSYIKSNLRKIESDGRQTFNDPFQGQSNYLINAALLYDLQEQGLNMTLLFNQIGKRIAFYGDKGNGQPAIWEAPRPVLDFQASKKLIKGKAEIRMNISDILNQTLYFYQNTDAGTGFNKATDAIRFSRKYGTTFSFTFGYTL